MSLFKVSQTPESCCDVNRAGTSPARTLHDAQHDPSRVRAGLVPALGYTIVLAFILLISSCNFPGTQQRAQQPDPRLKLFHVLSERIIMLDTQAEVDGTVQNTGHDRYPYDVTLMATFYNSAGNVIGQAQGVAEDILPGMTGPFVLMGQVDSSQYSRMVVTPISLRERRVEKNLPTPPVVP